MIVNHCGKPCAPTAGSCYMSAGEIWDLCSLADFPIDLLGEQMKSAQWRWWHRGHRDQVVPSQAPLPKEIAYYYPEPTRLAHEGSWIRSS